jgi:hypothetical protein
MKTMLNGVQRWLRHRRLKRSFQLKIRQELEKVEAGEAPASEVGEAARHIKDFQDLIQAAHASSPLRRLEKIAVAVALCVAFFAVTFLVFKRVGMTDVEAELNLSEASFVLARDNPVSQPFNVMEVQIYDTRSVTASTQRAVRLESPGGGVARIRGMPKGPKGETKLGQVTLPGLALPKGTEVSVKAAGSSRFRIRVSLPEGASDLAPLGITAQGPTELLLAGGDAKGPELLSLETPYTISVVPLGREFTLEFAVAPDAKVELLPQILVGRISFRQEEAESQARQVSAVNSGSVIRTELGSDKIGLRPFEPLNVEGCDWEKTESCLRLRRVTMAKDAVEAQLDGNATSLKAGRARAQRDLMPSLLEWINSNHHIKLLWTAILFSSGLLIGLIRWMTKGA